MRMKKQFYLTILSVSLLAVGCAPKHHLEEINFANSDFDLITYTLQFCNHCDEVNINFQNNPNGSVNVERYSLYSSPEEYRIYYFNNELINMFVNAYFNYDQNSGKYINYSKAVFDDVDMYSDIELEGKSYSGTEFLYDLDTHSWRVDNTFTLEFDESARPTKYVMKQIDNASGNSIIMRETDISYIEGTLKYQISSKARSTFSDELLQQYVFEGEQNSQGKIINETCHFIDNVWLEDEKKDYFYNETGQLIEQINYHYNEQSLVEDKFEKEFEYTYEYDSRGRLTKENEFRYIDSETLRPSEERKYSYDIFDNLVQFETYEYDSDLERLYLNTEVTTEYYLKDDKQSQIYLRYENDGSIDTYNSYKIIYQRDSEELISTSYNYDVDTNSWVQIEE